MGVKGVTLLDDTPVVIEDMCSNVSRLNFVVVLNNFF